MSPRDMLTPAGKHNPCTVRASPNTRCSTKKWCNNIIFARLFYIQVTFCKKGFERTQSSWIMHHAAKDSPMRLFVLFLMRQKQGVDPRDVFILLENNSINNNKSLSSQGDASHRSTRYCRTSIAFKLLGAVLKKENTGWLQSYGVYHLNLLNLTIHREC